MGKESEKPAYLKGNIMTSSSSRNHNGTSARRTIAVLAISASVLLTGTVYGYAAVRAGTAESTISSPSVFGPSLLKGPLTDASVNVATETAAADTVTFSVGGPSHLKGPLK